MPVAGTKKALTTVKPKATKRPTVSKPKRKGGRRTRDDGLTDMQFMFAQEYLKDFNGTQAALRAGCKPAGAHVQSSKWLKLPKIQELIEEGRARLTKTFQIEQDKIVRELAHMGFCNVLDYVEVRDDGEAQIDLSRMTREQAAAITEITSDRIVTGSGESKITTYRTKIKLADKRASLMDLAKIHGYIKSDKEPAPAPRVTNNTWVLMPVAPPPRGRTFDAEVDE